MTQKINNLITNYKRASTHARAHTYFNHIKKQVKFLKTLKDVAETFRVVSKETGLWTVTGAVRLNSAARRKRRYWRNGGKLKEIKNKWFDNGLGLKSTETYCSGIRLHRSPCWPRGWARAPRLLLSGSPLRTRSARARRGGSRAVVAAGVAGCSWTCWGPGCPARRKKLSGARWGPGE